jgi:hypothetical protein
MRGTGSELIGTVHMSSSVSKNPLAIVFSPLFSSSSRRPPGVIRWSRRWLALHRLPAHVPPGGQIRAAPSSELPMDRGSAPLDRQRATSSPRRRPSCGVGTPRSCLRARVSCGLSKARSVKRRDTFSLGDRKKEWFPAFVT